jgi:hypothetical protein
MAVNPIRITVRFTDKADDETRQTLAMLVGISQWGETQPGGDGSTLIILPNAEHTNALKAQLAELQQQGVLTWAE